MASDTLKQIADNLGVSTINGSYLSGIADYYGVNLATSTDLMRDILVEVGGNPATSTDYLKDIVLELGGTVINANWMDGWQAITGGGPPPTPAPVNTVLPNVTGTAVVGNVLTTDDGTWTNSPTSYAYQWKRGATNIGTNANTYTLVTADAGESITCVVTATNGGGSTPATSNAVQVQNFFTTTWTTTAPSETIALPYTGTGTYTGTIDWGDGNTSVNDGTVTTHTYATAGTYTVIIDGDCIGWNFGDAIGGSTYITSVVKWGQLQLGTDNIGYNFYGCPNLDLSSVQGILDLTGVTNLNNLFSECYSLTTINNINSWDTSAVTNMGVMFSNCTAFNQALSFNTSAVISMNGMFSGATAFNQALSFDTSAVIDMTYMFLGATAFNQPLSFNTSAVIDMESMFYGATAFNQNIGGWNVASLTSAGDFMGDKTPATFSTTNLNAIYNGWSTTVTLLGVSISFGTAKYTSAGVAGRLILTVPYSWFITDGGL
jgi:surface protein